jgi:hypothetical protein
MIGQIGGDDDAHHNDLIAAPTAAQERHTLAANAEDGATLHAGGNAQMLRAIDGRHFNLDAQRRLRHIERQFEDDVVALADKVWMRLHVDHDIQIAVWAAAWTGIPLTADPDLG